MARRKRNAGKGFGMMFHGAFGSKEAAKKKERQVHGFIQPRNIRGERRFVVMSERKNPRKRNPKGAYVIRWDNNQLSQTFQKKSAAEAYLKRSRKEGYEGRVEYYPAGHTMPLHEPYVEQQGQIYYGKRNPPGNFTEAQAIAKAHRLTRKHAWAYIGQRSDMMGTGRGYDAYLSTRPPEGVHYIQRIDKPYHESEESRYLREHSGYNPSELLVMGANPAPAPHEEIVLQPHRTYTLRVNPSAAALREKFTGMPAEHSKVYDIPGMPAGEYAKLGDLLSLFVKPIAGGAGAQVREIRFNKNARPDLIADTNGQLYFINGDQDITDQWTLFNHTANADGRIELGEVRKIDYKQRKVHLPEPDVDEWQHMFGEESGVRPTLWFNSHLKRLELEGGEYSITPEGIRN
jgi:hypothetical protein